MSEGNAELITIAEMLEADGDEWNVANSLRRIASQWQPRQVQEYCEAHEPISTPHCPVCLINDRDHWREVAAQPHHRHPPEPTHYALIDDRGEIVIAYGLNVHPDAEAICQREREEIFGHIAQARDWTVKGITVPQS